MDDLYNQKQTQGHFIDGDNHGNPVKRRRARKSRSSNFNVFPLKINLITKVYLKLLITFSMKEEAPIHNPWVGECFRSLFDAKVAA